MSHLDDMLTRDLERLNRYIAAETAILEGAQSYTIGNRTLTRVDLDFVQKEIDRLDKKIIKMERRGAIRTQTILPRYNR